MHIKIYSQPLQPGQGGVVPGRSKNLSKDFILSKLHRWKSVAINGDPLDMGKHIPHIKTYYQVDSTGNGNSSMRWFMIGSHNMSKAAWGQIQYRQLQGEVLTIPSWELSVFISPSTLGVDSMGPLLSSEGYSLGGSSDGNSTKGKPLNPQQLREQRLARFGGNSSISSTVLPKNDTKQSYAHTQNRAIIPLPYKFIPDKYEPSDLYWHVELLQ